MTDDIQSYPHGIAHLLPPVHPGAVLADELEARGLSAHALALALRVPANRLSDIVRGRRAISAETALRLGRYLGTSSALWLNLQAQYDLAVAMRDHGAQIAQEVAAEAAPENDRRARKAAIRPARTIAAARAKMGVRAAKKLKQGGAAVTSGKRAKAGK
jgi:antitoxin HigA-1